MVTRKMGIALIVVTVLVIVSGCTTQFSIQSSMKPEAIQASRTAAAVSVAESSYIFENTVDTTPMPTVEDVSTPKKTIQASITPRPTSTIKPKPKPMQTSTAEPTPVPSEETEEYTFMPQSYLQAVCDGVNLKRQNNGEWSTDIKVVLDAGLCEMSKAHAMEMAKKGDIFHSCPGAESVTMGASSNGKAEGGAAAIHSPSLLDPEIIRLGVGAVKTGDGTIFLCVVGQK